MTDGRLAPPDDDAVRVRTTARAVPHADPLSAYLALANRFGREEVYLLESAAGAGKDRAYDWTGFCALVTVSVTRSVVRVEGVAALREAVVARIAPLLDASGGELRLRHPRDLWQVLRAVQAAFRAEGSATRFRFGFLGFFGYDAARYIEDLPYLIEQEPDLPDVHLALYQGCLVADRVTGRPELLLHESGAWPRLDPDEIAELLGACGPAPAPPAGAVPDARVSDDTEYGQYLADVSRCKEHIGLRRLPRLAGAPLRKGKGVQRRLAGPHDGAISVAGPGPLCGRPPVRIQVNVECLSLNGRVQRCGRRPGRCKDGRPAA